MASRPSQSIRLSILEIAYPRIKLSPLWFALGLLGVIDAVWLLTSPLRLSADSWRTLANLLPFLIIGGWGAFRLADRPLLQTLCRGGTFMLAAWPVLRLYNHLTMATSFPFADNWLATADAFMGFNWMQYALWLDKHPGLLRLMDYSYTGLTTYSMGLFLLLLFGRDPAQRCQELVVLFFSTALICSTVGMFFPAEAAAIHYQAQRDLFHSVDPWVGTYHIDHLLALRTDPEHVLILNNLPGLVTFPSFHTAMGVVAIYCARGTTWLLGPSLIVNLLMIGSTPLLGSHYLVDVIAGASVAVGAILFLRHFSVSSSRYTGFRTLSPTPH